jgi:RNA 2',3'-cyclic 3'-phosphodiesterase
MSELLAAGSQERRSDERWRVFASVPVNDAVRSIMQRAQNGLRAQDWPVRWVDPRLAHVTLRFYGDSDMVTVAGMRSALAEVAGRHDSLRLQTGSLDAFPSPTRARVFWLGLDGDVSPLRALVADINAGGEDEGNGKRSFKPHVTLARLRNGAHPPSNYAEAVAALDIPSVGLAIDRILLVRSVLGPKGPAYTTIGEWPLNTPAVDVATPAEAELHEHG